MTGEPDKAGEPGHRGNGLIVGKSRLNDNQSGYDVGYFRKGYSANR
jgi:hypothetical protein